MIFAAHMSNMNNRPGIGTMAINHIVVISGATRNGRELDLSQPIIRRSLTDTGSPRHRTRDGSVASHYSRRDLGDHRGSAIQASTHCPPCPSSKLSICKLKFADRHGLKSGVACVICGSPRVGLLPRPSPDNFDLRYVIAST